MLFEYLNLLDTLIVVAEIRKVKNKYMKLKFVSEVSFC